MADGISQAESEQSLDKSGLNQVTKKFILTKWNIIAIILVILFIIIVLLVLNYFHLLPSSKPKGISKSVPVKRLVVRGTLTLFTGSNITVDSYNKSQSFSLINTKFQKVVSGSMESGDAKTADTNISSLKSGQEVLVIADLGSTQAQQVYIMR